MTPCGRPDPVRTPLNRLRRNVQFYRDPSVQLQVENVAIEDVLLISKFVRAFRFQQLRFLIDHYQEAGISLFAPCFVQLERGIQSLVTPPVVEESSGKFIALEGNTRFLYCLVNNIKTVQVVVVRGVKAELPGKPVPLAQVRLTGIKHQPGERITGFDRGLFRDIERAVRPLAPQ
jgi:hypothetical protein